MNKKTAQMLLRFNQKTKKDRKTGDAHHAKPSDERASLAFSFGVNMVEEPCETQQHAS